MVFNADTEYALTTLVKAVAAPWRTDCILSPKLLKNNGYKLSIAVWESTG